MNLMRIRKWQMVVIILGLITSFAFSQPNWSLDPAKYEFTMTITGIGFIQCLEIDDPNDRVAAFINDEVRGVQYFDGLNNNRNFAYMVVYDSIFSGNRIHFKIYDASEDRIIEAIPTVIFSENLNVGNNVDPFVFNTSSDILKTTFYPSSVYRYINTGDTALLLNTTNASFDTLAMDYSWVNDSLGIDNAYFEIDGNVLVITKPLSIPNGRDEIMLHLKGTNQSNCIEDLVIKIPLTDVVNVQHPGDVIDYIQIYPNPARNYIRFETELPINSIRILDPVKSSMRTLENHYEKTIDLSGLNNQVYFLMFETSNGWITKSLVIMD